MPARRAPRQALLRVAVVVALVAGVLVSASTAPALTPRTTGPRWAIVPSASPPGPPNGALEAVACASTTLCFAVGSPGDQGTLIERWDGTAWAIAPSPAIGGDPLLTGVACPSTTVCFAVGSVAHETADSFSVAPLIERWNGTSWKVMSGPAVGAELAELNGISCSSPTSCIAVGDSASGGIDSLDISPLSERWDGTRWSLVGAPRPAGARVAILFSASCTSATSCLAVGASLAKTTTPLTERWNGTKWTVVPAPVPAGRDGAVLSSVSCSSATDCFAVGTSFVTSDVADATLTEHWNGTAWSVVASPGPAGVTGSGLFAVACTSPTDCSAVGGSFTLSPSNPINEVDAPLNEHWDGTAWSIVPAPSGPFTELVGVACAAAATCFAVGDAGLVEQWNGSTWSLAPFGEKASQSFLASVACPGVNRCFAVGEFESNDGVKLLVEQFNGSSWTIVDAPIPAGAPNSALLGVSCTSAHDCTAVGLYQQDLDTNPTLVEHWDGTAWSIVPSPSPSGVLAAQLTDVSCANPKSCNATGVAFGATASNPFALHWDGTNWTLVPVPTPAFAAIATFPGLSCPSANLCFLVGGYQAVTGTRQLVARTLIERWDGAQWKIIKSPDPGVQLAQLGVVSCSSASQCLAVGIALSTTSGLAGGGTLTERWDGKQWKIVPGKTSIDVALDMGGLACRSAVSCYGVGEGFTRSGGGTDVEHWGGQRWTRVPSATPPGTNDAGLGAVSCPTKTWCAAVGSFRTELGSFTLGMRGT